MKSYTILAAVMMAFLFSFPAPRAYAQQQEQLSMDQLAEEEADKLQRQLGLEDWQVFYVDSTLKANYNALQMEYDALRKSKVTNMTIYQEVKDKCWDNIDAAYKKYFTDEQWALYLKQGAAKLQKQRAKRRVKAGIESK